MSETVASPIAFPVNVGRLPQRGMPVVIDADDKQRRELAEIHGLEDVQRLHIQLMVTPWKRHGVRVTGTVKGKVGQLCVSTLEPLTNTIDEDVDSVFLPANSKLGREGFGAGGEIVLDAEGDDSPEIFEGDWIDVGALAEEIFGLGIDPYPHSQAAQERLAAGQPDEEAPASPFAQKLQAALKKGDGAK